MTKLVIYIPTYNRAKSLKICLSKIAEQIHPDVGVYIANNGSTDGTKEFLDSLNYRWLTVLHRRENIGGAANQVAGWYIPLDCEYIWVIGDDDYILPNALKTLIKAINEHPVDFIFCNTQAFAETDEDRVLELLSQDKFPQGTIKGKYYNQFECTFNNLIDPRVADSLLLEIMCLCVRKSALKKVNFNIGFEPNYNDFKSCGRFYTAVTGPIVKSFKKETPALYLPTPLTVNFWGGGNGWSKDYDFIFPIAILYMIESYWERKIISEKKYLALLDYYFKLMAASLKRQIEGTSTAKPFSSQIIKHIESAYNVLCKSQLEP